MNCQMCSAEAAPGSRFCAMCGAPLARTCTSCGAVAAANSRFCNMCGTALPEVPTARVATNSSMSAAMNEHEGERRQLTVLFADVVGATTLSGQMDPEALRALLREYQGVCVESVGRYDGTIHQYAGDGVLAYFGFPIAHDNDAERAVLAGLAIVAGVRRLTAARRARDEAGIAARIGIHTGLVVIGEMGAGSAREIHAIGETPNVAARIQAEAAPDSVAISAATLRLTGRRFQVRALGARSLKGVTKDMELFEVAAIQPAAGTRATASAPLVGRDSELQLLLERWQLATQGRGQAVLISGEGGIGKSRLLEAFQARVEVPAGAWRNIFCSPFYQNSALHPMIDLVERAIRRSSGAADRTGALRRLMQQSMQTDETTFALVAALLAIGEEHERVLRDLAPDQRRRRTLDVLIAWLHADAQRQPLVIVVEDLHWIDASTRDLLGMLLERIADFPILAIFTFRPEFVPTWTLHAQISMVPLARLAPAQIETVALNVAGGKGLPARIVEEIVSRTDGVPLFAEELTKMILDSGLVEERDGALQVAGGHAALLEIPATLRDSLTARLDRLGPAKAVAQLASLLGRTFDYPVLHAVCELPEAELEARLAELNRAEIIQQRGVPPQSNYVFKHALIQEAAYDTLLRTTRQLHHRRVAQAYEECFPEVVQTRPELIAHHYSRALMPAPALAYWQRAGELAVARSGYNEALGHLGAALEEIKLLPESTERAATELALRVKIGPALQALKGMGATETGDNYARACQLAEASGDRPERFMALWGDWLYKTTSGAIEAAARRSEDLVNLSRRLADDNYILQAHHSRWTNYFMLGNVAVCRADTLRGIALYDRDRHRDHKHLYGGHDPNACAHYIGGNSAWLTGHVGEALELAEKSIVIGQELDHPFSLSLALVWSNFVFACAGQHVRARRCAEDLIALSEQHGFKQWMGSATIMLGGAQVAQGATSFGLKLVEQGVEAQRTTGLKMWGPFLFAAAAEAHLRAGNHARALDLLTEAIDLARNLRAGWYLPEMERLRAEALLQTGSINLIEAGHRLDEAARLAAEQSARVLQWRAELSLARVLAKQGERDAARARLNSIFSAGEGLDAPELLEAKRLLDTA